MNTAPATPPQRRVEALDLLRLVAALSVVVYHYTFRGAAADGFSAISLPAVAPVTKYAYFGVEMFFVISGFVIAWSTEGRNAREFLIARAARIYPGFLACMTITFAVTMLVGMAPFQASIGQWFANLFILAPALRQPFMDGVYWTIVYELTFYGWMFLFILAGIFPRRLTLIVVVWLALSAVNELLLHSSILLRLFVTDESGFFCAGLLLYALHSGRRTALTWPLLAIAATVAAGQSMANADWMRDHFALPYSNVVIAFLSVGVIALVGRCIRIESVPLPAKVVMALGGLTYPLYLLHQQAGFIALNRLEGLAPPAILMAIVTAAMLLASFLVWRLVERPGQKLVKAILSRLLSRPPLRPPPALVTHWVRLPPAPEPAVPEPAAVFGPVSLPRASRH
jgi:peptidoglycan/LPS O-acetylase OafA/YrhL